MPNWVEDEDLFKKAVTLFIKNYGHSPKEDKDWAIISGIYKKLGGRVKSTKKEILDEELGMIFKEHFNKIANGYESKLDKLMEKLVNV